MKVNDWFKNGCDWEQGVAIYIGLKQSKPNLIRLFKKKYNATFHQKLKYELSKFKEIEVEQTNFTEVSATKTTSEPTPTQTKSREITLDIDVSPKPTYKPARLNQYPLELHPVFIQQKTDYYTACTLKIQLNNLPAEAEEEALKLCIEIERLFDSIENAWQQLDYYTENKLVLKVKTTDFTDLTPAQLLQRRTLKRSSISKLKKRIANSNTALTKATTKPLKTKLEVKLGRDNEKLIQLKTDVDQLTKLINGE